jgi:hypothetical protein
MLEGAIARANGRTDQKQGNLLDRINRSMTSIAMMFVRANIKTVNGNADCQRKPKGKQQSTSL